MHECAYLANFFVCYQTDPLLNQLVPLNNIKQLSNGVANLFSIRELHPTHGFKQRPLLEDVITNHLNIARRRCPKRVGSFGYSILASEEKASGK